MKKFQQYTYFTLLAIWGMLPFFILCGEDTPGQPPMSNTLFFGSKIAAFVSLYCCYKVAKVLNSKGLLPPMPEDDSELI